jgi:phosphinothricin acetyltransferase
MPTYELRPAKADDLPALLAIYNHYVETSHITFDTEPATLAERQVWFRQHQESGPHRLICAELGGQVVGYVASSAFHYKPVYAASVETSIYISPAECGRGLGTQLLGHLIEMLEAETSVHRLYAGITLPNEASMALHTKHGFEVAGTFSEVSQKSGRFWDLCWLERPAAPEC